MAYQKISIMADSRKQIQDVKARRARLDLPEYGQRASLSSSQLVALEQPARFKASGERWTPENQPVQEGHAMIAARQWQTLVNLQREIDRNRCNQRRVW